MAGVAQPRSGPPLPELRQELRLLHGPRLGTQATWLLYDPVRHRYFQISARAFELLRAWRAEPAEQLAQRLRETTGEPVDASELTSLATFVVANNLSLAPPGGDACALARQYSQTQHTFVWSLIHNYLFFKLPLVRPERFLRATMPFVEPLFSRSMAVAIVLVGLTGLYFASRQWDLFATTFLDFLSFEGALVYAVTLLVVKALHELGHAYVATRAGVRVTSMGVAFMLLAPLLYTDVTDAWRLKDRRSKLMIDAAGIVVELALAAIALFLWAFLPDGIFRSAAFVTATTSLVLGLLINLNPLMRFDGYHILADAWQIPNLQQRSNDLAVWRLREFLFGLGRAPPETFPPIRRCLLVLYALCVWIYRLLLFFGIALVVYHLFFKALGVVLFLVEIVWFILLPVARELMHWWTMRTEIAGRRRAYLTGAMALCLVAVLVVPFKSGIAIQAVALSDSETRLFAPRSTQVVAVGISEGQQVEAGHPLVRLASSDLTHEIQLTRTRIDLVSFRLARIAGDSEDLANKVVLESELERHRTHLGGLEAEAQRLVLTAPHPGVVRDLDRDLRPGDWIDGSLLIGRVVGQTRTEAKAYVHESDLWRLTEGTAAVFVPEDPTRARRLGRIVEVEQTGISAVEFPYLASVYGGSVASDRGPDNIIKPRSGYHLVRVEFDGPPIAQALRGTVHLSARPESFAAAIWRRVLQVLVRESSV